MLFLFLEHDPNSIRMHLGIEILRCVWKQVRVLCEWFSFLTWFGVACIVIRMLGEFVVFFSYLLLFERWFPVGLIWPASWWHWRVFFSDPASRDLVAHKIRKLLLSLCSCYMIASILLSCHCWCVLTCADLFSLHGINGLLASSQFCFSLLASYNIYETMCTHMFSLFNQVSMSPLDMTTCILITLLLQKAGHALVFLTFISFKYPNFLHFSSLKLCSKFWIDPHPYQKHYPQRERISSVVALGGILQNGQQLVCCLSIPLYEIHMIKMFHSVCRYFLQLILQ